MQTFPHLSERKVALERNIATVLSVFPEFNGRKVAGARGKKQLWGFTNANVQRRYEREYAEYYTPSDFLATQWSDTGLTGHPDRSDCITKQCDQTQVQSLKVANTVLISKAVIPVSAELTQKSALLAGSEECNVPLSMLLGVSDLRHTIELDDSNEGRFLDNNSLYQTLPAETMTQRDIVQKISEIKQRPSRKRFFGSEHRLAHVRRYGREDVHDESEGAWKPRSSKKIKTTASSFTSVGLEHKDGPTTARQLFGLPKNPIPVNSGQSELAFRDGILVSILSPKLVMLRYLYTKVRR
jgi:hypothetical protein